VVSALLCFSVSAKNHKLKILENLVISEIAKVYDQRPEVFEGADEKDGLVLTYLPSRLDLLMADLVDQLYLMLSNHKMIQRKEWVKAIVGENPIANFPRLLSKIRSLKKKENRKFFRVLNNNWIVQDYSIYGHAYPFKVNLIRKQRALKIKRNPMVHKFNIISSDPESIYFLRYFRGKISSPFPTKRLTVTKMKYLSKKEIKAHREIYYTKYLKDLDKQDILLSNAFYNSVKLKVVSSNRPSAKVAHKIKPEKTNSKIIKNHLVPLYNAIHAAPYKIDLMAFITSEFKEDHPGIPIPSDGSRYYFTKVFLYENLGTIEDLVKEYTYKSLLLSQENDEVILKLRKWVLNNNRLVFKKLKSYNRIHPANKVKLSFKKGKKPKRYEVIDEYHKLELIMPNAPWMKDLKETILGRKGHPIVLGKNSFGRFIFQVGRVAKKILAIENVAGTAASLVISLTTGNVMVGSMANVLIRDTIHTLRHGKKFKDGFKGTPADLAKSLVSYAPWIPGHYFKLFSVGILEGTVQGILTGQNVLTSAVVGGTLEVVEGLLPTAIGKPTIKIDLDNPTTRQIISSVALEVGHNMVRKGAQGAVVALLTNEEVAKGFKKGAIYGAAESSMKIVLFGIRVNPLDYISEEDLEAELELENAFQNYEGVGEYNITVEDILDSEWRVETDIFGITMKLNGGRAYTGPGFVSLADDSDIVDIDTVTHEGSHIELQDSGLFTFYYNWGTMAAVEGTYGDSVGGDNIYENYRGDDPYGVWNDAYAPDYNPKDVLVHTGFERNLPGVLVHSSLDGDQEIERQSDFKERVEELFTPLVMEQLLKYSRSHTFQGFTFIGYID
jgi:hypothetical protein